MNDSYPELAEAAERYEIDELDLSGHVTADVAIAGFIKFFLPHFHVEVLDSCNQLDRVAEPGCVCLFYVFYVF